jgi:hypothetical protein
MDALPSHKWLGYFHRVALRHANANCPHRPSQNEYRKRAVQVRNSEMGSATVPVAVFGVAPKTLQPTNLSNDGSGATPEPARETRALPPI